jgi:hypothetical protein
MQCKKTPQFRPKSRVMKAGINVQRRRNGGHPCPVENVLALKSLLIRDIKLTDV